MALRCVMLNSGVVLRGCAAVTRASAIMHVLCHSGCVGGIVYLMRQ
jgi:hypothetical protein